MSPVGDVAGLMIMIGLIWLGSDVRAAAQIIAEAVRNARR